jgi:hypothetical protein
MSAVNESRLFFPYSNPTSHSECTAEQAYKWSRGKAIFASGSPFDPVTYEGRTFTPGQGNNVFIFPAMGLAVFATEAKRVTDEMLLTAAEAVAEQVTMKDFENGLIYPHVNDILQVSVNVAEKVAEQIFNSGLAGVKRPKDIRAFIKSKMYEPALLIPEFEEHPESNSADAGMRTVMLPAVIPPCFDENFARAAKAVCRANIKVLYVVFAGNTVPGGLKIIEPSIKPPFYPVTVFKVHLHSVTRKVIAKIIFLVILEDAAGEYGIEFF